jgi:hypothetical protein
VCIPPRAGDSIVGDSTSLSLKPAARNSLELINNVHFCKKKQIGISEFCLFLHPTIQKFDGFLFFYREAVCKKKALFYRRLFFTDGFFLKKHQTASF